MHPIPLLTPHVGQGQTNYLPTKLASANCFADFEDFEGFATGCGSGRFWTSKRGCSRFFRLEPCSAQQALSMLHGLTHVTNNTPLLAHQHFIQFCLGPQQSIRLTAFKSCASFGAKAIPSALIFKPFRLGCQRSHI